MTAPATSWRERLVEAAVALAGALGANRIRLRWRLNRWVDSLAGRAAGVATTARHVTYAHKTCPRCGAVNPADGRRCASCGDELGTRLGQVLRRLGLLAPDVLSMPTVLAAVLLAIYLRMLGADSAGGLLAFSLPALVEHGGHVPAAVAAGQWWRLGSAIFLHAGLLHLGFNVLALTQIGPPVQQLFGGGRTLSFFMLTGVLANLAGQLLLPPQIVGIGASGAVMGLIGVAAGWGQRDGTTLGRGVRNHMLQWALYTMVFGFVIGANNVAHAAGFISGAGLGYLAPRRPRGPQAGGLWTLLAAAAAALSVAVALWPALTDWLPLAPWPG